MRIRARIFPISLWATVTLVTLFAALPTPVSGVEVPCDKWEAQRFRAGIADEFAFPADPASRGAALDAAFPEASWKSFDSTQSNRLFGHTFTNLPPNIVRAQLTLRMRPHADIPTNDALHLGLDADGSLTYGIRISALPEAGGTWNPQSNSATTFVLDLSDLPGTGADLVPKVALERTLDVLTQDDTAVDYLELAVWACPPITYRAGIRDDFAAPNDAAVPGADLRVAFRGATFKSFDDSSANRFFGHTFTGLPDGIVQAELEIRMRPHADTPTNDVLHLGLEGNGTFTFGASIAQLPEANGSWTQGVNPATVFTLDLGDLPGGIDLIPRLTSERKLEVLVQDDTAVDDIRLRLWTCPPPYTFEGVWVNGLGESDPIFADGAMVIDDLSASGEDGIVFDLVSAEGFCLALLEDCPEGYWKGSALELAVTSGSLTQGSGSAEATLTLSHLIANNEVGIRTDIDGQKDVRITLENREIVEMISTNLVV